MVMAGVLPRVPPPLPSRANLEDQGPPPALSLTGERGESTKPRRTEDTGHALHARLVGIPEQMLHWCTPLEPPTNLTPA